MTGVAMDRPFRFVWPLAAAAVLSACTYQLQESHLVRPQPAPATDLAVLAAAFPGYAFDEARIDTGDGASLYSLRLTRPDARATVLYFGGNGYRIGVHAQHSVRAYEALPVNLVLVDHRGYGGSSGIPTMDGLRADALLAYDRLRADPALAELPLLVHGQSLGSFLAGHVAGHRRLDGLVLESSMTTAEDWTAAMRARAGFWTRLMVRRIDIAPSLQAAGNLEVVRTLDEPVLFVVGADDTTTAPVFSRMLHAATPLPAADKRLVVVPGKGHNTATLSPEFAAAMAGLIDRVAPVAVTADDAGA
ncbi:alpha/beta hydrolase [Luteimonas yindakuii]|uniref:Alpha/beta hydrolase n=2 Tax=Luteimonas yindakuii TaxID=2565782 RepID=A0A4Z1RL33_9GAMM|nr:alpha/beta hydrolase [Luteimonas yindakuii]